MVDSTKTKFSTTLIAITGLITAIGSVITILFNVGIIGNKERKKDHKKEVRIDKSKLPKDLKTKEVIIPAIKPEISTVIKKMYNLTGKWVDINNSNGRYQINHEDSGIINFTEYSFVFGEWVITATGTGTVSGTKVTIPYTTYLGTSGKFTGKITNRGKKVEGKIQDFDAGITAELNIKKQ